jgi:hypothetical protein
MEIWYFLSANTLLPHILPRLLVMGMPTAFLFIPFGVCTIGRGRVEASPFGAGDMSPAEWCW